MSIHLGRLKKVDLREFFKDEARDFTPWLAEEDNLELLSETLGIDIELEDIEVKIGKFSADIVGDDISSNRKVIIENQLEKTNHDHLGKIITYSGGKGAGIVIWVCKKIQQEHRSALDWLNEISTEEYSFFGIEMELWKIGDSEPAPKFNIVVSPNEWSKTVKTLTSSNKSISGTKMLQKEFWTEVCDFMSENTTLNMRSPRPQHWHSTSVGKPWAEIALTVHTRKNIIGCELYISNSKTDDRYYKLLEQKDIIESQIGSPLEWMELENKQASRIVLYSDGNIKNRDKWEPYVKWCSEQVVLFHSTFSNILKNI